MTIDPLPDGLLTRARALEYGFSDLELAAAVRRGALVRLQRGAYLATEPATAELRHRSAVLATVAGLRLPGAVGHVSAAVLHGLPVYAIPLERVHLVRRPQAAGSGSARVHLHVARLPQAEVVALAGIAVTTVTRTVVDLARSVPFESAVVTADAALARGATTTAELVACLERMGPVPGSRRAARVLAFADDRSESVGESRSRVLVHRLGLPVPVLQIPVLSPAGTLIGRCDFGWPDLWTVGEFDGRTKYGRLLRPGQSAADAVYEEKLREDALRDADQQVVRWTWPELSTPPVIGQRLLRAFERGRRRA
ncbi:hypothetical protein GB931_19165 [Modestobacter sp. I12A-02628]|uniref:Transcriptional regulator, AbiEi antitoxin, Type IV TA system n=1 Tax=Goekera deserti TaxID=2497753 RepID=A0A7K3WL74_9ACTN|nr:hypothetical protein [Goekera deserti]MPR00001.1 hypothetical protein [Goekera deserti]NDI49779.1 hypothetical protein [Goekera deserti]NEL56629.1 hypothetical protein [Goekera deserti]